MWLKACVAALVATMGGASGRAHEEDVEQRAGDAGDDVEPGHGEAAGDGVRGLGGVEIETAFWDPGEARHEAEHADTPRLSSAHRSPSASKAAAMAEPTPYMTMMRQSMCCAVQHGAPAVRHELHCAVRHHRGGDRHGQRQRAHQHQPAGHAEDAGNGRGTEDGTRSMKDIASDATRASYV